MSAVKNRFLSVIEGEKGLPFVLSSCEFNKSRRLIKGRISEANNISHNFDVEFNSCLDYCHLFYLNASSPFLSPLYDF